VIHVVSTYVASAMSISGAPLTGLSAPEGLADRMAHLCVQPVAGTELAWQHTGLSTLASTQLLPLQARQGSGVSSIAPMTFIGATFAATKRNRSFEDQLGPRVRSGTG
jgi:hypothetical protein